MRVGIGLVVLAVVAARGALAQEGRAIYGSECSSCHALDGKGVDAVGRKLKVRGETMSLVDEGTLAKSDDFLVDVVLKGVDKMPGFQGRLTEGQIKAVIAHIRRLGPPRRKRPRKPRSHGKGT